MIIFFVVIFPSYKLMFTSIPSFSYTKAQDNNIIIHIPNLLAVFELKKLKSASCKFFRDFQWLGMKPKKLLSHTNLQGGVMFNCYII